MVLTHTTERVLHTAALPEPSENAQGDYAPKTLIHIHPRLPRFGPDRVTLIPILPMLVLGLTFNA